MLVLCLSIITEAIDHPAWAISPRQPVALLVIYLSGIKPFLHFQSLKFSLTFFFFVKVKVKVTSVVSDSLQSHGLYNPWNSLGQNTGVGSLSLLQGIFPTPGPNPGLPHCRRILYQLSHKRSPRILEWVAYPFSSGSSQLRNQTGVSCIAGRFFTN